MEQTSITRARGMPHSADYMQITNPTTVKDKTAISDPRQPDKPQDAQQLPEVLGLMSPRKATQYELQYR
jgi:hypothetical protein